MTPSPTPDNQSPQRFMIRHAITQAFRLPGGRHFFIRLLLWTVALLLLTYLLFGQSVLSAYFETFLNIYRLGDTNNPEALDAAIAPLSNVGSSAIILSLLTWLIFASAETAFHKNHLRGTDHGLFPLRFGIDEARVMVAQFFVWLMSYGALMIGSGLSRIAGGTNGSGAVSPLGFAATLGSVLILWLSIILFVRFSPAAALSVRDKAFRTHQGWGVTRGHVGPILGSYILIAVLTYLAIVTSLTMGLIAMISDPSTLQTLEDVSNLDTAAVAEAWTDILKTPGVMITAVVSVIIFMITLITSFACFWGIGNYIAQWDARLDAKRG